MSHRTLLLRLGVLGLAVALMGAVLFPTLTQALPGPSTCYLTDPAFCDTFDAPSGNGGSGRAGDMDNVVWGVGRGNTGENIGQGLFNAWPEFPLNLCGTVVMVKPWDMTRICNGLLVEGMDDNETVAIWAAYPRQPFDFAGRTGKATFDVSDDTEGSHSAWPTWMVTDQPIPVPDNDNLFGDTPGMRNNPRNAIGIEFAGYFDSGCNQQVSGVNGVIRPQRTGVNHIWTQANFIATDAQVIQDGCVQGSNGPNDPAGLNHVEIDISATRIDVYMSDPGGGMAGQRLVAHVNYTAPITRGLTWMEDAHYNANKVTDTPGVYFDQRVHTFAWDNFGFDGPLRPRDIGVEYPESKGTTGKLSDENTPLWNLGYLVTQSVPKTVTMTLNALAQSTSSTLEFTFFPAAPTTITYQFNGFPIHTYDFSGTTYVSQIVALPAPLTELINGANTIAIGTTDPNNGLPISNINLILAAPGGTSTPTPGGVATATPTVTPTPLPGTATPTPTPVPGTATPTPTPRPGALGAAVNITPPNEVACLGPNSSGLVGAYGFAMDPNNRMNIYLPIEDCSTNNTLYHSTDGGSTWGTVGTQSVDDIRIDPANSLHMWGFKGTRGSTVGLYQSFDGGVTWSTPASFSAGYGTSWNNDIFDIAMDPANFNHMLVSFHSSWPNFPSGGPAGIVETTDGGSTWTARQPGGWTTASASLFFLNNSTTWLLATQDAGMWRTTNSGVLWTQVTAVSMDAGGTNMYCSLKLAGGYCDPAGILYVGGFQTVLRSTNGGTSFTSTPPAATMNGYYGMLSDGVRLYVQNANIGNNTGEGAVSYYSTLLSDGLTWTNTGISTCLNSICDGPAVGWGYDPVARAFYSANWGSGLWKIPNSVSVAPTPTPGAATATPTSTATPTPTATPASTATPTPAAPTPTPTPASVAFPTRIGAWNLYGANMPWLNWNSDFGGGSGGGGVSGNLTIVDQKLAAAQSAGMHYVRWWVFEGGSPQILRDASGNPTGINANVYTDIDAALVEAAKYDISYDLVLFGGTNDDAVTHQWWENASQRAALTSVLTPLFQRYANQRRIHTWEVVNEPEWQSRAGQTTVAGMLATFDSIAAAIHSNTSKLTTVGNAQIQDMATWQGHALDYYSPHYYDNFGSGVPNDPFTRNASTIAVDNKAVVIGELTTQPAPATPSAQVRNQNLYDRGYAGAWAWSLSPEKTSDAFAIDLTSSAVFANGKIDLGPRLGSAPTPTPTPAATATPTSVGIPASQLFPNGALDSFWDSLKQTGSGLFSVDTLAPYPGNTYDMRFSRAAAGVSRAGAVAGHNVVAPFNKNLNVRTFISIDAVPSTTTPHVAHLFGLSSPSDVGEQVYFDAHSSNKIETAAKLRDGTWHVLDVANVDPGVWIGLEIDVDGSGVNPIIIWKTSIPSTPGVWTVVDQITDTTTGSFTLPSQLRIGAWTNPEDTPWLGILTARFDTVLLSDRNLGP